MWRCVLVLHFNAVPDRTYRATDTRLDSLPFGCIMGIWMNPALDRQTPFFPLRLVGPRAKPLTELLIESFIFVAAVAVLVFTFVFRNDAFRETLRYTLQGMALFPIFWLAVRHADWPIFRPLNWPPIRFLGVISYVFYLSHFFWLDMATRLVADRRIVSAILAFIFTTIFSIIVHKTVELPFAALRRKLHKPSK